MVRATTDSGTQRAARFAAVFVGYWVGHQAGDYWVQSDHQATTKGGHGSRAQQRAGQAACAAHVSTYTAATTATVASVNRALGLGLGWRAVAAGQVFSAVTHYAIDRRYTLAALARATGKAGFLARGGAPLLDQAAHTVCLGAAALITARMARGERR